MNIKTIIASLVLASSSAAMAAPGVTVSATAELHVGTPIKVTHGERHVVRGTVYSPPIYVDRRHDNDVPVVYSPPIWRPGTWAKPPVFRSVMLADDLAFTNEGRRFITVGAQAGTFGKLEIKGSYGRTFIKQVYVQFDNGQEQVVRELDRTLGSNECLTVDLDGNRRAIKRIVVYGYNVDNGFRHEANAFDVTAI